MTPGPSGITADILMIFKAYFTVEVVLGLPSSQKGGFESFQSNGNMYFEKFTKCVLGKLKNMYGSIIERIRWFQSRQVYIYN